MIQFLSNNPEVKLLRGLEWCGSMGDNTSQSKISWNHSSVRKILAETLDDYFELITHDIKMLLPPQSMSSISVLGVADNMVVCVDHSSYYTHSVSLI